jgi:hypothetical protein
MPGVDYDSFFQASDPSAPDGWIVVNQALLEGAADAAHAERYADGGAPTWQLAADARLLPRPLTDGIIDRVLANARSGLPSVELLIGAAGEGKTTALMQTVARLFAADASLSILWRTEGRLTADVLTFVSRTRGRTILASDNAHLLMEDASRAITADRLASHGAQVLLAARDTSWQRVWRNSGHAVDPASTWRQSQFAVNLNPGIGEVSEEDALRIVRSWQALGVSAKGLAGMTDAEAATALADVSQSQGNRGGALLGGLLAVRYTPEALRAHIADLLEAFNADRLPSRISLADVLTAAALAEIAGIDGIPREVVASMSGVDIVHVRTTVEDRLGHEAVASSDGDRLHIRHPMIAQAVVNIASSPDSVVTAEWAGARLIESTVAAGKSSGFRQGYGEICDIGRRLYVADLLDVDPGAKAGLVYGLLRVARSAQPDRLDAHVTLSLVYRESGQPMRAVDEIWLPLLRGLLTSHGWVDWDAHARGALNECSAALGSAGLARDAFLAATAGLSEICDPCPLLGELTSLIHQLLIGLASLTIGEPDARLTQLLGETLALVSGWAGPSRRFADFWSAESGVAASTFPGPQAWTDHLERAIPLVSSRPGNVAGAFVDARRDFTGLGLELIKRELEAGA